MKQVFEIPKGCNRVTIEQQGNKIVTTFEPEFKDGDILVKKYIPEIFGESEHIFILDNIKLDGLIYYKASYSKRKKKVTIEYDYGIGSIGDFMHLELRYATESEKQLLFDALAKVGKQWNAEKKCIEDLKPKRWRAEEGCVYCYAVPYEGCFGHCCDSVDYRSIDDNKRYEVGNYFKTKAEANSAGLKMKELLKQINP